MNWDFGALMQILYRVPLLLCALHNTAFYSCGRRALDLLRLRDPGDPGLFSYALNVGSPKVNLCFKRPTRFVVNHLTHSCMEKDLLPLTLLFLCLCKKTSSYMNYSSTSLRNFSQDSHKCIKLCKRWYCFLVFTYIADHSMFLQVPGVVCLFLKNTRIHISSNETEMRWSSAHKPELQNTSVIVAQMTSSLMNMPFIWVLVLNSC